MCCAADSKEIWISLVEAEALDGVEGFGRGEKAFVNEVVLAGSLADAELRLQETLRGMHFHCVAFEDTEPLSSRMARYTVCDELVELATAAQMSGEALFGTFYGWENQG
jgi:hypothetical protein